MPNTIKKSLLSTAVGASLIFSLVPSISYAQQTGAIKGNVADISSAVTVTATSNVMPKPRTAKVREDGSYNLPALLPGNYQLTFTAADGTTQKAEVYVLLDQTSQFDLSFAKDSVEVINIIGTALVKEGNSSLTDALGETTLKNLPYGQDYREMMKLIPGVQYTENTTLGASAGGSGRDNTYGFDGADLSLPMFGNLSSEPSTHDIANVSMDRGAAKAIGFNRSGGFAINSSSKSGTNEFTGSIEYKAQPEDFSSDKDDTTGLTEKQDESWIIASVGGPLIEDELFFYGSYYRPEKDRVNKATAYGSTKDYSSTREEYFGKLTWAPTDSILINASHRDSDRTNSGESINAFSADSTSEGSAAKQVISVIDGSYLLGDYTTVSFKYSKYELDNSGQPDTIFDTVQPALGSSLDIANIDQLGLFSVPILRPELAGYDNAGAQALIDKYGYVSEDGTRMGDGTVGGAHQINQQDFKRESFEVTLDHEFDWGDTTHYLHFGVQWKEGTEVLGRTSNGWGRIYYRGGVADNFDSDVPVYYEATVEQMSLLGESGDIVPAITSSGESINIELHDTIEAGDFTYDLGLVISQDELFGQGLKENANNVSGYELAPGNKYKMHTVDFADMIQPRLGVTWQYEPDTKLFANFASYNPEATSLARAASWARNTRRTVRVFFDQNGDYIGNTDAAGSSGKFFQEGMDPRRTDEITLGFERQVSSEWLIRGHARKRKALHPWEDTPNSARLAGDYLSPFGGVPADIAEKGLYIPDLDAYRAEVGGSSYVIAELDGAVNTHLELSLQAEYFGDNTYVNASYTWSNYYGNYDQDVTGADADLNSFIGSSNLGDGNGRQLWDGKYGKLNGHRPHLVKVYGYYTTPWEANVGAYFVYQTGDVWEAWDGSLYGYSSSTIRYAEPAGSRTEPSHWQLDLNYAQEFDWIDDVTVKFKANLFNVFDQQTGYDYNPYVSDPTFGEARKLINPRRLQLSVSLAF